MASPAWPAKLVGMPPRDPLERMASAAERIADAVEFLARITQPVGPTPELKVARAPSDNVRMEPVTLRPEEGLMTVVLQNVGEADTVVNHPTANLGSVEVVGELLDRDSRPQSKLTVPAAPNGPGVTLQFRFERQSELLTDLPLSLRVPHRPGQLPVPSMLEVQLEPSGPAEGRFQWRVIDSRVLRGPDGAS
jgi:hypothetical protein